MIAEHLSQMMQFSLHTMQLVSELLPFLTLLDAHLQRTDLVVEFFANSCSHGFTVSNVVLLKHNNTLAGLVHEICMHLANSFLLQWQKNFAAMIYFAIIVCFKVRQFCGGTDLDRDSGRLALIITVRTTSST